MSSMGSAWPDEGTDGTGWSFLGSDPLTGIIPVPPGAIQTPSLIPLPSQDQSAAQISPAAYPSAPPLPIPNAGPPAGGMPNARGFANALDLAGYFPEGAAIFANEVARLGSGDNDALKALNRTTPYLSLPLAIGSGIADSVADIQQGANPLDAVIGNGLRTAVTLSGAAAVGGGLPGVGVALLLNRYLPNGAGMGKAILEPVPNDGLLYAPPLSPE